MGACGGTDDGGTTAGAGQAARGADLFAANCATCHGADLQGTGAGPPLIHEYYVPSHHADEAFLVAVRRGAQPHHWDFGAMPPVEGLDDGDVAAIVTFVRERQAEAGLIE